MLVFQDVYPYSYYWCFRNPVNSPVEVGSLYPITLQGFEKIPGGAAMILSKIYQIYRQINTVYASRLLCGCRDYLPKPPPKKKLIAKTTWKSMVGKRMGVKTAYFFCQGLKPKIWGFPKIVVPNNHWFSYQKWSFWGVLGVPPFQETPICWSENLGIPPNRSLLGGICCGL